MPPDELTVYFEGIYNNVGMAELIPFRTVLFSDNTSPLAAKCHENVDRWISENPGHVALRGWLIEAEMGPIFSFAAHSVVQETSGRVFDVTPIGADYRPRFIRHIGSEGDFEEIRKGQPTFLWPQLF